MRTNRTLTVSVAAAGVPTWVTDDTLHPQGAWQVYATNGEAVPVSSGTPNTSDSRQRGLSLYSQNPTCTNFQDYLGGAVDQTTKRVYYTGGGHGSSDNSVSLLDLNVDTPRWYLASTRTDGAGYVPYSGLNNGQGQYASDFGTARFGAFHTLGDIICDNGYVWIPGMWGMESASYPEGTMFSQRFRAAIPSSAGTQLTWEKLGVSYGTEGDDFGGVFFGEDGPVCLIASRNQIWRGGNNTSGNSACVVTYCISTLTGSVLGTYTRGSTITQNAIPGTSTAFRCVLPQTSARFNMYAVACEIYPPTASQSNYGRPAMVVGYLNSDGSRAAGWYLWDVDSAYPYGTPSVYYGPLNIQKDAAVAAKTLTVNHAGYSYMQHLHGTQRIYMSYGDWNPGGGGYTTSKFMRLTIPTGTTAEQLAAGTWLLEEITPAAAPNGAALPPVNASNVPQISGKFNLVQNMGDNRPAIVLVTVPTATFSQKPHVWVCKMPVGGL